jgi:hypothetical protein
MYATGTEIHSSQDTGRCQIASRKKHQQVNIRRYLLVMSVLGSPELRDDQPNHSFLVHLTLTYRHRSITTGRRSIHAHGIHGWWHLHGSGGDRIRHSAFATRITSTMAELGMPAISGRHDVDDNFHPSFQPSIDERPYDAANQDPSSASLWRTKQSFYGVQPPCGMHGILNPPKQVRLPSKSQ